MGLLRRRQAKPNEQYRLMKKRKICRRMYYSEFRNQEFPYNQETGNAVPRIIKKAMPILPRTRKPRPGLALETLARPRISTTPELVGAVRTVLPGGAATLALLPPAAATLVMFPSATRFLV
jgi:hypothetical protein